MGLYLKQMVSIALGLACFSIASCDRQSKTANVKAAQTEELFPVQVMTVQPSSFQRTLNAVGTVRYRRETPLGFTTSGKLAQVNFEEGQYVKRGQLLASLDTTPVVADLDVSDAERVRAQAEFERMRALYAQGWVTKGRYEAAEAAVKIANARVRQSGFTSRTARLYAPSGGTVLSRFVQSGQVVSAGSPALILGQDNEGFIFRAPVIDKDASKLRKGMLATIIIESLGQTPINASISEIDGRANESTGAFTVQLSVSGKSGLRSGQIGSVQIKMPAAQDGTMQIPASALVGRRAGEALVFIVDPSGKKVETRSVVTSGLIDDFALVTGGIIPGDIVVVSGAERLRAGSKIRIIPGEPPASAATSALPAVENSPQTAKAN
jgi:RND family efflux transporter MFP subunit